MTDRLTPGEQRFVRWLPLIAEECAEIVKDAMKGLRFGLHDRPEDADKFSADNLAKIKLEIADLLAVLQSCGLDFSELNVAIEMKKQKLRTFGPDARPSPYLIEAARREADEPPGPRVGPSKEAAGVPRFPFPKHIDAPPPPAPFVTDHKWLDPECHASGCQTLILKAEIEKLRDQRDKYMWQVRDTCRRAEAAEVDARFNLERRTVEREAAKDREATLRAALKFYADPEDYKAPFTGGGGKLYFDCGKTARDTLAGGNDG